MTKYTITADIGYLGYQPGDEVNLDLDPDEEKRALEYGWIKPVKAKKEEGKKDA